MRKTSAFKKVTAEPSERADQAAEAGAAVVSACLGVMYAVRRGARIVVVDTKSTVVDVTQHRRGEAAAATAKQALDAVDSLGCAAVNAVSLVASPESLAFELSVEAADNALVERIAQRCGAAEHRTDAVNTAQVGLVVDCFYLRPKS